MPNQVRSKHSLRDQMQVRHTKSLSMRSLQVGLALLPLERCQSQQGCAAIGICGVLDLLVTGWEVFTGLVRLGPTVCIWAQFTTGWTRWYTLQLILCWDCHVFAASIGLTGFCNTAGLRVQFAFFSMWFSDWKRCHSFQRKHR